MDRQSVEAGLTVHYATNGMDSVDGRIHWFANTMVFAPSEQWTRGAVVEVSLAGAMAANGAAMEPLGWMFPVVPQLALASSNPRDGARNVYPGTSLVLEFTAPVDGESFLEKFSVEPKTGSLYTWWSSDTTVYVDFYPRAGTEYVVTIAAGLEDRRGGKMGEEVKITFATGDDPPSFQLADSWQPWAFGTEDEAAAVVSFRNVESITLSLYSMSLSDVIRFYGDDWDFRYNFAPKAAELLRSWTVETDAPRNQWTSAAEPLAEGGGPLAPGLYYVTAEAKEPVIKGSLAGQVAIVASENITLKWTADAGLAWVTGWHDGKPTADATLSFFDSKGRRFSDATTGVDGTAITEMAEQSPWLAYAAVVGEPGSERFGITLSSWTNGISPWRYGVYQTWYSSPYTVHIYTDRPVSPGRRVLQGHRSRGRRRALQRAH